MRPVLWNKDYLEVIESDIHTGKRNANAAVGARAAKAHFVPQVRHRAPTQRMTWCVCGCRSPWANEVQYTGLNEAATEENDNGILCWIGRVRQRNVDLYYG
jgi:hypothetical protein